MIRFLQTPGKTKKIVLGSLLMVICGAMVITMVPGGILGDAFGANASPNAVASVGGQEISLAEVDQLARQLGRQQFPRGFPPQFLPFLRQRAAETLIAQKALQVEAERMGFKVSDSELREALRRIPDLFPNGQFIGEEAYQNFITQATGVSVPEFERRMKQELLVSKLRDTVQAGLSISESDIAKQYRHENLKVKFQYAVLSMDALEKQIQPTEKELREFHSRNQQRYANSIPEKRKVEYIVLDPAQMPAKAAVSPEELQRYYADHQEEYRLPEQVMARHILIKTPAPAADGKVDEKAVDAARQKAESLLAQLKKGGNFAELAKKNSEDPGSAQSGGSLGWIQRGRTVPEFEQSAFSLPKGELSGVIRTTYGFHILQVEDKQQAHLRSFDEVRGEIEPALTTQKAAQAAENLASKVSDQGRNSGLATAAKQNGLTVITSGLFARTDSLPGVGNSQEFMQAVFAAGSNARAEVVRTPQGNVIFSVLEVKPPSTPAFEEIQDRVAQDLKAERGEQLMATKTQELSDRARAEHDLAKAAKEAGAEIKSSELVGVNDQVPDLGAMSGPGGVAFDLKTGEISGPLNAGRAGVVLTVTDRQEPPAGQLASSRDRIRESLLEQKRAEFFGMFVDNLRKQMEQEKRIRINPQVMEQITKSAQTGD